MLESVVHIGLAFAWMNFTADTGYQTVTLLVFSSLSVLSGVLNLLVRAVVKTRSGKPLRNLVKRKISQRKVSIAMIDFGVNQKQHLNKQTGDDASASAES